jgi:hypothetical protein
MCVSEGFRRRFPKETVAWLSWLEEDRAFERSSFRAKQETLRFSSQPRLRRAFLKPGDCLVVWKIDRFG